MNSTKQFDENIKTILALEYMGIHIEDTKEKDFKTLFYFSVPEKSVLKLDSDEEKPYTTRDLIEFAKETLIEMIFDTCKSEFGDNEEDEEFYEYMKNNISDYALFFAKVRQGEVWNNEMAEAAIMKLGNQIKDMTYKQV